MFVTSYSVTYCIYVPGKPGICLHFYCAVYDEWKYLETFWLADRTRLFVQYIISLSSLCKLIWRHWTYKMPVRYILSSESKIKHILSVIHYTICGAVCFQFTHFCYDDWENIYIYIYIHIYMYIYIYIYFVLLSSSNREFGSMNYYPLFRVRSWNNDVRCMSFYILLYLSVSGHAKITAQMSSHVSVEKTQQMQRYKSTDDCIAHLLTWFAPWNEVIILMLYVIYKWSQINPSWVSDSQYDCMYVPAYYK